MTREPPRQSRGAEPGRGEPSLGEDETGALQIGPTDQGMVRLMLTTRTGYSELDFTPDEARDIADELLAAAERADADGRPPRRGRS